MSAYRIQSNLKVIEDLKESFSKDSPDSALGIIHTLVEKNISFRDLVEGSKKPRAEKPALISILKMGFSSLIARLIMDRNVQGLQRLVAIPEYDFIGGSSFYGFYSKVIAGLTQDTTQILDLGEFVYNALVDKSVFEEDRSLIVQAAVDICGKHSVSERILDCLARRAIANINVNTLLSSLNRNELLISFFSLLFRRICESKSGEERETFLKIGLVVLDESSLFEAVQPLPAVFYATRNNFLVEKANELSLRIESKIGPEKISAMIDEIKVLKQRMDELRKETEEKKIGYIMKKEIQDRIQDSKIRTKAFYEAWKDEEIVRILGKVADLQILFYNVVPGNIAVSGDQQAIGEKNPDVEHTLDMVEAILRTYNVRQIGTVGDITDFDNKFHESLNGSKIGTPKIRVVRPGYVMFKEDGNAKYVVRKTIVEELEGGLK